VRRVDAGSLKPNVERDAGMIALGPDQPQVSAGGNDIIVDHQPGGSFVLFFTFRGILSHYSGFLYVPRGRKPEDFSRFEYEQPRQLAAYADNWYFVAR
jgi:hypothetical protein